MVETTVDRVDAPPEQQAPASPPARREAARLVALAVALPVVLFVVLRPNTFGIVPNPLDPVFYTGYALNLEGILTAAGDDHYFITRWTTYLPSHYAIELFGPYAGRLLVRLGIAAAMLLSIWTLRPRWSTAQRLLVGTVVLSMPIFVRAFMTDYVETTVVSTGFVLVAMSLAGRRSFLWGAALGALTAIAMIANPFAAVVAGPPLALAAIRTIDRSRGRAVWRAPLALGSGIVAGGATVGLFGLYWFRYRFDVPNVYQPTIDWIRANSDLVDTLKAQEPGWWWYYTWIWSVPVLLAAAVGLHRTRRVRFDRTDAYAFGLLAVQYLLHWFDHLVSKGNSIEVPYYWSFIFPTFGVALALFLGRLTTSIGWRTAAAGVAAWVAVLVVLPTDVRLPVGVGLVVVLVAAVAGIVALGARSLPAAGVAAVLVVLVTQVAAPGYADGRFGFDMNPRYDEIFWSDDVAGISEDLYREIVWFEDELDPVPRNGEALFVPAGGPWSGLLTAVYGAHVGGQLIQLPDGVLTEEALTSASRSGTFPVIVLVGIPEEVDRAVGILDAPGTRAELLAVADSPEPIGSRLAVFDIAGADWLPYAWAGSTLPTIIGEPDGTTMTADADAPAGYVTYGPYVALTPGTYRITLAYRSDEPGSQEVATFELAPATGAPIQVAAVTGSDGDRATRTFTFEVTDPLQQWEFRVLRAGGQLTVEQLELSQG